MTKQPSQNSIIFFAALGVYLGLLVAGASPGVIAQQAALTRSFDISEEIESSDDLDRDPEVAESVESPDPKDGAVLFTFDSFFSSLAATYTPNTSFPETATFSEEPATASGSIGIVLSSPLTSRITVSNFARAGI